MKMLDLIGKYLVQIFLIWILKTMLHGNLIRMLMEVLDRNVQLKVFFLFMKIGLRLDFLIKLNNWLLLEIYRIWVMVQLLHGIILKLNSILKIFWKYLNPKYCLVDKNWKITLFHLFMGQLNLQLYMFH